MRQLLLGVVIALAAAAPAAAVPGKPTPFYIPPKVMPNVGSTQAVTFGWREVTFDGPNRIYEVFTDDLTEGGFGPSAYPAASGDTNEDRTATLTGFKNGHRYRFYLHGYQTNVRGANSDPVEFVFDNQGPDTDFYLLHGTTSFSWHRLPTVQAYVSRFSGSDATRWEVSVGSDPWPCTNGFDGCADNLNNGSGSRDVELPSPDGVKYVYVRMRDDARRPVTSRTPLFTQPPTGNVGPVRFLTGGLDTTAPVAKLAAADIKGTAGQASSLDATPSTDASSGVSANKFEWRWGDSSANQLNQAGKITHTYPGPGVYDGRVLVYDAVGNFSSTTFKVTIDPAAVATVSPTPEPTAEPTVAPTVAPTAEPTVAPTAAPDTPPASIPDIPLEQLPTVIKANKGAIAQAKAPQTIAPRQDIDVKLKLRRKARVKLTLLNAKDRVVKKETEKAKAGRYTVDIKAPKKPGEYTLLVKAPGAKALELPITVAKRA